MNLPECHVFIASSLDGFIARPDGDIRWLTDHPTSAGEDFGYAAFVAGIDALVMGSGSFAKVKDFPQWPYPKPVLVLSHRLGDIDIPEPIRGRVQIGALSPQAALASLADRGVRRVYVDGGRVIQSFLRDGLIRSITLTHIPILLGEGLPLFGPIGRDIPLSLVEVRHWASGFVQTTYRIG